MTTSSRRPDEGEARDAAHWAPIMEKLRVSGVPEEALSLNVEGRRVLGPLQGFGKMWQKTYRVRLSGSAATPTEVIKTWKENFPKFWGAPRGNRFYAPITGIAPGEVAVLNLGAGPMKLSTGVMVLYADDESFTLMTPQGHMLAGWITFSSFEEEGCTVAQAQEYFRGQDPLSEIALALVGHNMQEKLWEQTLRSLAAHFGVEGQPQMLVTCVDPKRQWSEAKNLWHNAAIRSMLYTVSAPARWMARPFKRLKR
ncbi:MAG: hypothetical protein HYS09_06695 [Chloroflexi bacterium]|nr:hypothetical protein [Chloroflexota bacterium]